MTAPSFKLHCDPITINCRKVLAGAKLLGVPLEQVHVDYFTGAHKQPEYTRLNPNGSVPTLVHGDLVLWESNAILMYLADGAPGGERYYPKEPRRRADVHRWLMWEAAHWFPACYVYLVENVVKPLLKETPDQAVLEAHAPSFHRYAAVLEQRLGAHEWLLGSEPSIADIAVAAPMHVHRFQRLPLDRYAGIRRWLGGVEALECWRETDVHAGLGLAATE